MLALPFWLVSKIRDSEPPPEPWTLPLDVPPPVEKPPPRPRPEYSVFPTKSDYDGPENLWWDVDDVSVGKEHGRPEDEWWDIDDVKLGSEAPTSSGNETLIQFWGMVGLVFLLTFVLLGANGAAFTFALLSTSVLLVIFYQIGPLRSMLGNE